MTVVPISAGVEKNGDPSLAVGDTRNLQTSLTLYEAMASSPCIPPVGEEGSKIKLQTHGDDASTSGVMH